MSGVSGVSEMRGVRDCARDEVEGLPRPSKMRLKGYLGPLGDYDNAYEDDNDHDNDIEDGNDNDTDNEPPSPPPETQRLCPI